MWPVDCPPCYVADPAELPPETRPYYQAGSGSGWILRDILDHLMSVNTPVQLRPVYEIRQYSHRRASFLKRNLVPDDSLPRLPALSRKVGRLSQPRCCRRVAQRSFVQPFGCHLP